MRGKPLNRLSRQLGSGNVVSRSQRLTIHAEQGLCMLVRLAGGMGADAHVRSRASCQRRRRLSRPDLEQRPGPQFSLLLVLYFCPGALN
jgi:hypothetical protein